MLNLKQKIWAVGVIAVQQEAKVVVKVIAVQVIVVLVIVVQVIVVQVIVPQAMLRPA